MYFVYVIRSISHQTRYVGHADSVSRRIKEHNDGKCRYTSGRCPWELIRQEEFNSRAEAMKREIFLKSGQSRKYLDEILKKKK